MTESVKSWHTMQNEVILCWCLCFFLLYFSLLLVLTQGFNATLTEPVDTPGRRGDQIKEMDLKLHPELKEPLTALCSDLKTTVVVLSGSDRNILDDVHKFFLRIISLTIYASSPFLE